MGRVPDEDSKPKYQLNTYKESNECGQYEFLKIYNLASSFKWKTTFVGKKLRHYFVRNTQILSFFVLFYKEMIICKTRD